MNYNGKKTKKMAKLSAKGRKRAADMGTTANQANLDSGTVITATGVAATAVGDQIGIHITADAEIVN